MLAEYDENDNLQAEHIYGLGRMLAKFAPGAGHGFFYTDHLGSTRLVGGSSETSDDMRRDYYPYGEALTAAGNDDTPYTFVGKELDGATGLHYFGARYYDRRIGRWYVPDALAQKHPEWSPYNYVLANPLRLIDPDGRQVDVHDVRFLRDQALSREGATERDIAAFHRADAQVEAVGASTLTLLFAGSRTADALIGLAQDVVTGNLGMASLLNFVPGGDEARQVSKTIKAADAIGESASRGKTVLGRFPDYTNLANELGAHKFNIPAEIWNKMSAAEQWTANVKFLDRLIARGDEIILSNPVKNLDAVTGTFRKELDYLIQKGYQLSEDGTRLIK